ncbi:heme NO-binding domain-containing protein [Vibrio genomosp. F10]|uniref:Guanylate cyclase n=2 Tax=Vibrio genomosp. F10 TaxID=723171 RepID=A0A1E5BHY1_9VIBR|nr:heme NO-binding domain-containing protein [Vibrio genomosp. F10]OEE36655.1 guanylate cyclase [Vibrio genomosp. F10 str. ZF-129]OEE98325.1 guanylate cyclase [Vibrio genomosp. F10 str. 9ZC157]OEF03903.1 guanylate cyclase [Vibrio genomosp. F10 str. 9ZB36]
MKGLIFTEFMELVEREFGLEVLDTILDEAGDSGIYTSVGSYDHKALVKLIVTLSKKTDIPSEQLQEVFGQSVFITLYKSMPDNAELNQCASSFQFIRHVEDYIHLEVKKLYPDAKPPSFDFISETQTEMVFDYKSARCMSHVCLGLIKGCAEHFNESVNIATQSQTTNHDHVRFTLTLGS